MATDRIVGIDLGTTNSLVAFMQGESPVVPSKDSTIDQRIRVIRERVEALQERIKLLEVEERLDYGEPCFDERDRIQQERRSIERDIDGERRLLHREINTCHDGGREATLWERCHVLRAHKETLESL
jgi:molecular chaperone DnaK (HSP70)